jgi:signal transduction histidine kinase
MKKKIFLGIILVIFFFTIGGFYLANTFNQITGTLQNIITLNRMEFEKKTFLNKIEVVQTDLLLKDSPHAIDINLLVSHVEEMEQQLYACDSCHHDTEVQQRINALHDDIKKYLHGLSRVYTLKDGRQRLLQELNNTFKLGSDLTDKIVYIIAASSKIVTEEASISKVKISKTKHILILLVTAGPLFFIITTFLFMKGFTRSLSVLTDATRKIQSGKLQYRIKEELKDEFGELASSFNEMAASLQEQCNIMQEAERLAVVGELAASIAHEIKNPLAGIKVSMEVLGQDLVLNQEDKDIFQQVINEIDRITALLRSLLNYARPPKPESISFDVHQVLDSTIKSAQYSLRSSPEGERKEIEFIRDFSEEVPRIVADPAQIQQVILNLLLNGVDAIAEQGKITVQTRKSSDRDIRIAIVDTGRGIDSQAMDKVFKPFFTTKSHGTGLGLAICKRLIEQSGGSITVANNPEGAGVTFVITMPIQPESEDIAQ